jgi:hypothetical protein
LGQTPLGRALRKLLRKPMHCCVPRRASRSRRWFRSTERCAPPCCAFG